MKKTVLVLVLVAKSVYGGDLSDRASDRITTHVKSDVRILEAEKAAAKARDEIVAKKRASGVVSLVGTILQKVRGGMLIECTPPVVVASSSASIGGGGRVYSGLRSGDVFGTFLLKNHPNEKTMVDGDFVDTEAYPSGIYTYTSTLGAVRTVRAYSCTPPAEEPTSQPATRVINAPGRLDKAVEVKEEIEKAEKGNPPPSPPRVEPIALTTNLLLNPNNEMPPINGKIPHWAGKPDSWYAKKVSPETRIPQTAGYFAPPNVVSAWLTQDVPVEKFADSIDRGIVSAIFSGYLTGAAFRDGDKDFGQLYLTALDAEGKKLSQNKSQRVSAFKKWTETTLPMDLPKNTKTLRCQLYAERRNGKATNGYFDDLSLVLFAKDAKKQTQ